MNFVQPIRDPVIVRDIAEYFKKKKERDYIMYLMGIYLGRRISDTLAMKIKDVRDKDHLKIRERKTGKMIKLDFHPELKRALQKYCEGKDDNDYLIKSRNGKNKAITRERAWEILKEAADAFNLDQIGTHSLRKIFGYHLYINSGNDIALVQKALEHEDENDTIRYLGIDSQKVNRAIKSLKF